MGRAGFAGVIGLNTRSNQWELSTTRAEYERDGVCLIDLPSDVDFLRQKMIQEMSDWVKAISPETGAVQDLPDALVQLAKLDRSKVGKLYKVSRRFPAARQLACHPWLVGLAKSAMGARVVSCCTFVNVRIDLPQEERFLLPIHQDFPYIQGSLNGVTVWLPLFDTELRHGPPSWIKGSHKWGVLEVREEDSAGSGAKSFSIAKAEEIAASHQFESANVMAGQALLFSTLLVHRSELNTTSRPRLNVQIRFDDALALESIERNYPEGLYLNDSFSSSYPEYVQ